MKLTSEKKIRPQKENDQQDMGIRPSWISDKKMAQAISEARMEEGTNATREEMKKSIRS